jgi:hypothetical protein
MGGRIKVVAVRRQDEGGIGPEFASRLPFVPGAPGFVWGQSERHLSEDKT